MMREILFRGKRVENGEWIYGYPLVDTADCSLKAEGKCSCPHDGSWAEMFFWEDDFHEYELEEVDSSTIGQYTGLTDKNGKKIFEGDIVEAIDYIGGIRFVGDKQTYVIKFIHGGFSAGHNRPLKDFVYGPIIDSHPLYEIEVIGNIHDNPELLEGVYNAEE